MMTSIHRTIIPLIFAAALILLCSCGSQAKIDPGDGETTQAGSTTASSEVQRETSTSAPAEVQPDADFTVPEYEGKPSVAINDNIPAFSESVKSEQSFEKYGELDRQGRCTVAFANLATDTQPGAGEERGDISAIHPSGWKSGQGWERCHLIGWALSAENDNPRNLVTGTHYMNVEGMLPYENEVNWYISDSGNHVLYEVTPVFQGKNMVCSGVHMQARSVEDDGAGVHFNVFCFNVSPGHEINYKTGEVTVVDEEAAAGNSFERGYVLNTNTMRFHYPSCSSVADMSERNKEFVTTSREELIRQGYKPCGNCEP